MTQLDTKSLLRIEEALAFYLNNLEQQKAQTQNQETIAQIRDDIDEVNSLLQKVKNDFDEQSRI